MLLGHRRTTQVDEEKGEGGGGVSEVLQHPIHRFCSPFFARSSVFTFFKLRSSQIFAVRHFFCSSALFLRFSSAFPLPFRRLLNNVVVAVVMCLEAGVCIDIGIGTRHFGVRLCGSSDCG
ncbi:hypothetical protein niasHT_038712 [Heterodera trifolii]|uniref:Uncharacterized protein n=1 Tax=Heterodera trifolii TaxID=157864 RepID=A0ABD2HS57_9BILA